MVGSDGLVLAVKPGDMVGTCEDDALDAMFAGSHVSGTCPKYWLAGLAQTALQPTCRPSE